MQYLKRNFLFDRKPTGFRDVVPADPAGVGGWCGCFFSIAAVGSQILSMTTNSQSAVYNVVRTEYCNWECVGVVKLPAHFFLQSLLRCVQPAIWPTCLCIHEARALAIAMANRAWPDAVAGADVDNLSDSFEM